MIAVVPDCMIFPVLYGTSIETDTLHETGQLLKSNEFALMSVINKQTVLANAVGGPHVTRDIAQILVTTHTNSLFSKGDKVLLNCIFVSWLHASRCKLTPRVKLLFFEHWRTIYRTTQMLHHLALL